MRLIDLPKQIFKLPFLEKSLASLTFQKHPQNFFARLPPLYSSYPKNSIRKVVRKGINYELDISDYMEWLVYFGIQAEPRNSLYELITKADTVFDIGANIGEITLNFANLVGSSGVVHSFEPDVFIFSKLSKNLSLNPLGNIHLNNLALGKEPGELFLGTPVESNRGGTRIQPTATIGKKVNVTTLDLYISIKNIEKIDLIKIDVEGFEAKVISGARETLNKFRPKLFVEINDNNLRDQGDSAQALIGNLTTMGYQIQNAETKELISAQNDFKNCHFDIIATYV